MEILKVLKGIEILKIRGAVDISVLDICDDSRKAKKGSMFICINGNNVDGHNYIEEAVAKGATSIVIENEINYIKDITYIKVEDTNKAMSQIAKNFFENPCEKINLIGVTGTNGKSSTVSFIKQILEYDYKVGMIGTIDVYDGQNTYKSINTTPNSLQLNRYLRAMIDNNCKYCVMEVSSHALALNRVDDIDYDIGIFTNLTQDHLDFHKNIDDYKATKEKLFYKTKKVNIFNLDDETGLYFYKTNANENTINYTYAIEKNADFRADNIKLSSKNIEYDLYVKDEIYRIEIPVIGYFNVYNTLAAIAVSAILGVKLEDILKRVKNFTNVPGRFEYVKNDKEIDLVVDYAHTPDALLNLLKSARFIAKKRIILVFGCGGNRDKDKRHLMGEIAYENSDIAIVTSDNPRDEKQDDIAKDIISKVDTKANKILIINDRFEAIKRAVEIYKRGDLIIIAGKGHEDYQIKNGVKYFFDDRKIAKKIIDNYIN